LRYLYLCWREDRREVTMIENGSMYSVYIWKKMDICILDNRYMYSVEHHNENNNISEIHYKYYNVIKLRDNVALRRNV